MPWDDAQLAAAIAAGNREAEEDFCRRFQGRVHRKVEATLRPGPDAEDLASEIVLAALTNLRRGSFRGECLLSTFVHAVARNKIAESLRRRRPETTEPRENIPDPALSPEEATAREEVGRAVRSALGELKPKYRNVLYLFYFRGLSVGRIAGELGVPPRRVSEWKDYGLKVIRSRCGKNLERFR